MLRRSVRWLAILLVASLAIALATSLDGSVLPTTLPTTSYSADGPSVITDEQGRFQFDGLHSASHILRIDPQSLVAGLPDSAQTTLTLSPGITRVLKVAPGLSLQATYHTGGALLDGVLFHDQNNDGIQSPGELGLQGARVIDPDIYQYFVPFQNSDLIQSFNDVLGTACLNQASTDPVIDSRVSLTASSAGTKVLYDHWEDGYDADPTVPGPSTEQLTMGAAGNVHIWLDNKTNSHTPAYDGRDRITVIGQPASLVRAAWLEDPGTRLAGAWEMPKVSDWGEHYIVPVGEDLGTDGSPSSGEFNYVSLSVMAAYDNTSVQIDADANGTFETTKLLNAGQTAYVRGTANQPPVTIHSGAEIKSSLPVQVQVRAGNCIAKYSGRSYTLVPVEKWSNDYWSPVSGFEHSTTCKVNYLPPQNGKNLSADVDIRIINPNATALTITYDGPGGTGTITVPAKSTGSYLNLRFPSGSATTGAIPRSNTEGVHLTASQKFWAVTTVDSTSLGNNGADFDWSYALIPANELSARVVLGWAPGNQSTPPSLNVNGSTVYVQAVADGTVVRADLDGDGTPDQFDTDGNATLQNPSDYGYNELTSNSAGVTLNHGQMVRISNPNTHDMTGAIIFSQDTEHPLAVVYGEDACIAGPQAPFLDLGYTVLPLPLPEISKSSRLLIDADNSHDISPGDTLEYNINVFNNGFGVIQQPVLLDTLPFTFTDFLAGSTTSTPTPIAPGITYDDGSGSFSYVPSGASGTPDSQVHAIKAFYADLSPGSSITVTLQIKLRSNIPPDVFAVVNKAELASKNAPTVTTQVTTPINQVDLAINKTDGRTTVGPQDLLTYTLTYTNAGPGIAHNVVMTDTLPPTAYDVSTPTVPGVITPTIQPGQILLQLGTLQAGQAGSTTVSLRLSTKTSGQAVNSVTIGSSSSETNRNNNTSTDIDQVIPADVLIGKTDGRVAVQRGDQLVYTLTYTNAGPGIAYNVVMTDTLPPTAINVSTPTVPGVITPTIQPGQILFQLGTLKPGQVGKTTVTLTLGPTTPSGVDVVNTADINSDQDTNPNNNHAIDIDHTTGPAAVVLSIFRATHQDSGVLISWRTVAEQDNYGFRIYRSSTSSRADATLVTPTFIAGQGRGSTGGASYSFVDSAAPEGTLYYWLEDVDLSGVSTFHGPAQPSIQQGGWQVMLPLLMTRN